jgi:hypothetical protein
MDSAVAGIVALFFFVTAGYAGSVSIAAIRTRSYAPELGLEVRGGAAVLAGWMTLVFAVALFGAGVLVWFVAMRA